MTKVHKITKTWNKLKLQKSKFIQNINKLIN